MMEKQSMKPRVVLTSTHGLEKVRPGDDGGASLQSAAKHMNTDYRNAVVVNDVKLRTIGWVGGVYDDRVKDDRGNIYKNVREALRQFR